MNQLFRLFNSKDPEAKEGNQEISKPKKKVPNNAL